MLNDFWDQRGVTPFDSLVPGETVDGPHYQQQLGRAKPCCASKASRISTKTTQADIPG